LPLQNKKWPLRSERTPRQKNLAHLALGDRSENNLPPLHIKLGLAEIFVEAMDKGKGLPI
jgi:hypothetical protein